MITATKPVGVRSATRDLVVLFAINVLNFYDRQAPGALAEPIRKEFGLSDTQLGLLGTSFIILYALIGIPLGRLADSWSRKKLLASGMAVWSALTACASLATSFSLLLTSRLGVALGEAVCAPTATSWIGDLFPAAKRSRALALFMLGVPIGGALSFFLSGPTAQAYGWRAAMVLAAAPAVILIPALLSLREPERGASETRAQAAGSLSVWSVLRIPTLWWIIASGALLNFIMYAFATFMTAFLSRVHGLSVAQAGLAMGISYGAGGVVGGLIAGSWGDYVAGKRTDGRMLSAAAAAFLAAPAAYFGIVQPRGAAFFALALLGVTYAFLNMYYGLVYSSIQDIVPPAFRGTTMAIYFMVMYLGGASFGPLLTGNLSDRMARRAADAAGSPVIAEAFKAIGLQQAMVIIPILSIVLGIVLFAGSRTIESDIRRCQAGL